jgi:hypothetical protein
MMERKQDREQRAAKDSCQDLMRKLTRGHFPVV